MNQRMFPVAIIAGGPATRLRPLTHTIPKSLVDVNGEPFIAHQLRSLHSNAIERVIICAGYLGEMIQEYVGDGTPFKLRVEYSFDGPRLLGTAGAIKKALPMLGGAFFVLYGDSYLPCEYRSVQTEFEQCGKMALMTIFQNNDRWDRSNVEFTDGSIVAYDKRHRTPRMRHIDYGLGVLKSAAFKIVSDNEPFDLEALYQFLLKEGELAGHEVGSRFYQIGTFEGLEETTRFIATQAKPQRSVK